MPSNISNKSFTQESSYDDVPRRQRRYSGHEYMNTLCRVSADSYPDLVQSVTKTPSPVARARMSPDNTDLTQLYAKV